MKTGGKNNKNASKSIADSNQEAMFKNLGVGDVCVINVKGRPDGKYRDYRGVPITNPSLLKNPFFHDLNNELEVIDSINKYKAYIWKSLNDPTSPVRAELISIAKFVNSGNNIKFLCYCKPKGCHGDVLVDAVKWLIKDGKLIK